MVSVMIVKYIDFQILCPILNGLEFWCYFTSVINFNALFYCIFFFLFKHVSGLFSNIEVGRRYIAHVGNVLGMKI